MNDDRLPATAFKSATGQTAAGGADGLAARTNEFEQARRQTTTRSTVGVYDRPERRTKFSLPLLVILILVSLISLVLSVRFLF